METKPKDIATLAGEAFDAQMLVDALAMQNAVMADLKTRRSAAIRYAEARADAFQKKQALERAIESPGEP